MQNCLQLRRGIIHDNESQVHKQISFSSNLKIHTIYHPVTARPFEKSESYMEFEPCEALRPYIRCFWGAKRPYWQMENEELSGRLITPDTCMDIIFDVNYTENSISNNFCGVCDSSFYTAGKKNKAMYVSTFGIRFYAWTAILFSEESMKEVKNSFFDVGYYFSKLKKEIEPLLFDIVDMDKRIDAAEKYLMNHIHLERENRVVMESIKLLLQKKGTITVSGLAKEMHISCRQLERLFCENTGVLPKQMSSLIRYQYLWKKILLNKDFNILDMVFEMGYTDQSHLLNDFKKYHTLSPAEAKKYAWKDVAFLQESLK